MAVHMSLRHVALPAVVAAAAALIPAAGAHAAAPRCSSAQASIARVSPRVIGSAVLCLVNVERTTRGLGPLRDAAPLRTAARRFSADMVARRFFDHVSPNGTTVSSRVRLAGYRNMSSVGENIGWGTGALATPAAIVRAWMDSPPHRAVILNGRFREAGVGVTPGSPLDAAGAGATFVLDVGTR
ncbi:MAG: hypothetical protein QOH46_3142 [Solirubrobacteraceae bacterium]|jgi:uncharacterized protein YkwD|nr:hypothetical protein [Solirubrobacteraceae bacterium]